jgi:hypothetical protein
MAKVFISYSHQDKTKVKNVVKQIQAAGHNVWIDERNMDIADPLATM